MNKNKILASVMCASTFMTSVLPVFATQTLTNDNLSNLEETEVLYSKSAAYMVTIPKTITLGSDKTSTYSVKVEGDISSDQEVYVSPVDAISETETIDFYMEDQSTSALKKDNVVTTITPTKTVWNFAEVTSATEVTDNSIEAKDLTSGFWKGVFNFDINLKTLIEEAVALEAGLYDANGVMLCTWEESGINDTCSNAKTIINNTYSTATKVVIPNNITTINMSAFKSCTSLTDVTIPDSVTSIGNMAFQNCTNLSNVIISEGVTSITWRAFDGCTSLSDITIPDSVTSIQTEAFHNCTNLTSVTYKNTTYTSKSELITALTNNGVTSNGTIFELSVFGSTGLTD